jgi:hypothetical protein
MPEEEFTSGASGVEVRVEPPKGPTVYESGKPPREDTSEAGRKMFEDAHTPPTAEEREASRREHNERAEAEREAAAADPNLQRTEETVRTPDTHPAKRASAPADKQATPADKGGAALEDKTVAELRDMARDRGVEGFSTMKKAELVKALS